MRYLAIGDIHGCLRALRTLADYVGFESSDVIITLGDYVDRGPNSCGVLDWLLDLKTKHHLIPLLGNHDLLMLNARRDPETLKRWLEQGGDATLQSYSSGEQPGLVADVPARHWQFLEKECRAWYETETHFFVHANAEADLPLAEQVESMLYWEKFNQPLPHMSGKTMVCGHTAQNDGVPVNLGHAVCIDTWVYGGGWITCLDPETGRYWQANQEGETRQSIL